MYFQNIRKKTAVFILLCLATTFAQAQNDPSLIDNVIKNLSLKAEAIDAEFTVTKPHPENKNATLVLLALPKGEDEDALTFDIYLVLADSKTGSILCSIAEKERYTSDAIRLTGFQIDTAPYKLAAHVRAVGIRASYTGSSRPNPFGEETLSLYIQQDKRFVKVLHDFVTYQSTGDWDTNCAGNFSSSKSVLVIQPEKTNGYNVIQVNTKTTETENIVRNEDCISSGTETKSSQKLIFNSTENLYQAAKN
jgi:hypothetical protein